MAIMYDPQAGLITLQTQNTTYQMQVDAHRCLLHLYYGERIQGSAAQLLYLQDRGFSANPEEAGPDRSYSLEQLAQEYPFRGNADYRTAAFRMRNEDGSYGCDLRFRSLKTKDGKYELAGLPSSYALPEEQKNVQTLEIVLEDVLKGGMASGIEVHLLYGVFEKEDVITRTVRVENHAGGNICLEKVASCTLDFPCGDFETLSFYGRHAYERNVQCTRIGHGRYSVASLRGASSHFYNPFVILRETGAGEDAGGTYGIHFVYSGNFLAEAEKTSYDQTRFVMGLNDEEFSWQLQPGESFQAPEILMAFSDEGSAKLSNLFHRFIREHIVRGPFQYKRRPILINNWEATYFNFDKEKILALAKKASELGIEMFVLDDGWFGKRGDDFSGLGDWCVNEEKLGGTLGELSGQIHSMGMLFGLWFEPEMVNEDSDLYRQHSDWVLRIPGRSFSRGRSQLVLDFSRKEVVDDIFSRMCAVLDSARIDYIKWDMNRNLTDVFSPAYPVSRQGEIRHRYVLGVYDLLDRLIRRYPHLLLEGCSGGGGRFDCGMLCYTPQIWCSDNTDAADRCIIQYGTSFGYPPITMGAHVSAVPNLQTGRIIPFETRAVTAMAGSFGYELDVNQLSKEELLLVPEQIRRFKEDYEVMHFGEYYRLSDPMGATGGYDRNCAKELCAWICVSENQKEAVFSAVFLGAHANPNAQFVHLKGLDEQIVYHCREDGRDYPGSVLLHAGIRLPAGREYESCQMHFSAIGESIS